MDGICGPNVQREILECDIHNHLMDWTIPELTFQVILRDEIRNTKEDSSPHHYYRQEVTIPPLQSAHITMTLGMQLPRDDQMMSHNRPIGAPIQHWGWQIVNAKGHHNQTYRLPTESPF